MKRFDATDNSSNVIDRFWQIDKAGPSGTATVTYTYAQAEVTGGVIGNEGLLQSQRYKTSTNIWDAPLSGQTADGTANTVIEPGITLFSPRTLALSSSPLPIELIAFNAKVNGRNVDLDWTTATETNNEFFTVERSADALNFEKIIVVKGGGNSSSLLKYKTADLNPLQGISYYRLKQTDYDGKFAYSQIVSVNTIIDEGNDIFVVFPNPASSLQLPFLSLTSTIDKNIIVVVRDVNGREIYARIIILENGINQVIALDPESRLTKGLYIISATSDNSIFNKKLIVE